MSGCKFEKVCFEPGFKGGERISTANVMRKRDPEEGGRVTEGSGPNVMSRIAQEDLRVRWRYEEARR